MSHQNWEDQDPLEAMPLPDHALWNLLEQQFRTRIHQVERREIIRQVTLVLQQEPEIDVDELTYKITTRVLSRSRGLPQRSVQPPARRSPRR